MRDLSPAIQAEVIADTSAPILLVKIETNKGDVNAWTGIGELTFNGEIYQGAGTLGGVSAIEETADLQANGVTFSLSGIPSELIATALGDVRQGLAAILWLGFMDVDTNALVGDPYELFSGLVDVPTISESGETAAISITAENRLIDLERPRIRRYTKEDQARTDSSDLGFDFVQSLQDAEILFGASR